MKIAIICYLFLMNVINFEAVAESFQHKVDSLSLLKEAYRNKDEETFLDLFPNSYAKFIEYYGYVENKPMPLYHEAFEHIKFLTSSKICKQKLLDKMVNIAKDAKWEADAPNYLREILIHSIQECPDTILSLLKDKEIKEINNNDPYLKCHSRQEQKLIPNLEERMVVDLHNVKQKFDEQARKDRVAYKLRKFK